MSSTPSRSAIITGGAQGMGEAIALRLAQEGVNIVVFDIKGKETQLEGVIKQVEAKGSKGFYFVGDVTVEKDIQDVIAKTVETFGSLDIMVANAGILAMKPITELTPEDFNHVFGINALGILLCYKHAAIQMIKQGRGGRIIGASSIGGKQAMSGASLYCSSKFAVRGMTQSAALELKPHGITVNAYAPGVIQTPMIAHPDDDKHGGLGSVVLTNPNLRQGTTSASPSVVGELVAYLCKPEAHFVNGQTIIIDGGTYFD